MALINFDILNRWSGRVQFTAEIECSAHASVSLKRGLAAQWAYARGADLRDADLRGAVLRDAPTIPSLDSKILAAIEAGGKLEMSAWHKCETTHCRAGWAITLAGEAGHTLEVAFGSAAAGALIYAKSYPDKPIPNFYADNDAAMADIKARAATDPKEAA